MRAGTLYANLSALPWGELSITATERVADPDPARSAVLGPDAWLQQLVLRWRVAGERRTAEHRPWVALVVEGDRVALAGTTDRPMNAEPMATPLWWDQPTSARSAGAVTVLAAAGTRIDRWSARATAAARAVRSALTTPWRERWDGVVVVEVPVSRAHFERVLGVPSGTYAGVAAVAWAEGPNPAVAAVRVVVNPGLTAAMAEEGVRVLLAHELTHVATGSVDSPAPTWLVEGFADWVAYRAYPATSAAAARPVLDRVENSGPPRGLPREADFEPGAARLDSAYAAAWLACRFLGERYGPDRLNRFYAAVDAGEGVDRAARSEFGTTMVGVTTAWRADLPLAAGR